ncbi:NAD(P)H-hydrate dehydratase [Neisseria chenwenguii]|uniref:ADP-dependent (S)-NAD(P)H-hydrate dehydratase n=1 Tax=Neisseria chenwenguii TaxID=1853278 RepID=A0A220S3F2_9NEIS|nr:NAD(P)H-hydrate dehydratase [Neisseria chenwenguii]ASK28000.1 NAD(P)H-hydrate dehydratase [Neisseria chenwenguii]ROV54469.1 NAD(P)H-hydrate dehydratase [Neisseria chenwenguii]
MNSDSYTLNHPERLFQTASQFPDVFKPRAPESHKGTYGTLAVIGGAAGMSGAVVLAATAAIYQGCGKVWAGFNQLQLPFAVIPERAEIMLATAQMLLERGDISAWVCGCGMGLDGAAEALLPQVLQRAQGRPLLLDADALTLLSGPSENHLHETARQHGALILTPHPAEAARLLGVSTAEVQQNRIEAVQTLSAKFNAVAVLKGRHTLVAAPNGDTYTNQSGNAGLATAGSGDVLSGVIGSLLAQGVDAFQAAKAGVWLHGAAADVLRDSGTGEIGLLAGEIAPAARWLRNKLCG